MDHAGLTTHSFDTLHIKVMVTSNTITVISRSQQVNYTNIIGYRVTSKGRLFLFRGYFDFARLLGAIVPVR